MNEKKIYRWMCGWGKGFLYEGKVNIGKCEEVVINIMYRANEKLNGQIENKDFVKSSKKQHSKT